MAVQPGRAAFKGAIRRFELPDPRPLVIRKMPFAESLEAAVVALNAEEHTLSARFVCGPQFIQGAGVVQGGVLAAMLDLSMAFVSLAVLPAELTCATAQLNVHYLNPARPGVFYSEAHVEKAGRRVLFNRAVLCPDDGGLPVASATAVFTVLGSETPPTTADA